MIHKSLKSKYLFLCFYSETEILGTRKFSIDVSNDWFQDPTNIGFSLEVQIWNLISGINFILGSRGT
jgi:hypothetical protein